MNLVRKADIDVGLMTSIRSERSKHSMASIRRHTWPAVTSDDSDPTGGAESSQSPKFERYSERVRAGKWAESAAVAPGSDQIQQILHVDLTIVGDVGVAGAAAAPVGDHRQQVVDTD